MQIDKNMFDNLSQEDAKMVEGLIERLSLLTNCKNSESLKGTYTIKEVENNMVYPPIYNQLLKNENDYMKNAYYKLLILMILQVSDDITGYIRKTFQRLLIGAEADGDIQYYISKAYSLTSQDIQDFFQDISDKELKYRFIIDYIVLNEENRFNKKWIEVYAMLCEVLNLKKIEAKFLTEISVCILKQSHLEYWNLIESNRSGIPNNIASEYMHLEDIVKKELFYKASEYFRMYQPVKALPILQRLANAGVTEAYALIYWIYVDGYCKNDVYVVEEEKALHCLKLGYESNDVVTGMLYALFYDEGNDKIINRLFPKLCELAEKGDDFAEYVWGLVELNKNEDAYSASKHFMKANIKGFYRVAGSFFIRYKRGDKPFEKNWINLSLWAEELLRYETNEDSFGYKIFEIAYAYMTIEEYGCNDSTMQKMFYNKAMELWEKLIAYGDAMAATNLGYMYEYSVGVGADYKKAFHYYLIAAEGGDTVGQANLANMYEQGKGVEYNRKKAIEWYKKSVEKGSETAKEALRRLGEL